MCVHAVKHLRGIAMKEKPTPQDLIEKQIRDAISNTPEGADMAEEVLRTLGRSKVIRYEDEKTINLLAAPGRVLAVILEDSSFTVRALAVYLGVTEQAITKSLKILVDAGLVKRTKVNKRYVHVPVIEKILAHRDIAPFLKLNEKPF